MSFHPENDPVRIIISDGETCLKHPSLPAGQMWADTAALAARYYGSSDSESGLLPPVVRYISPDFRHFLLEQVPVVATIRQRNGRAGRGGVREFTIPIPWTVYLMEFGKDLKSLSLLRVFGRNTAISDEDDRLYSLPLTNVYADHHVCMNNTLNSLQGLPEGSDTASYLRCAINSFWSSEFNDDVTYLIRDNRLPEQFREQKKIQKSSHAEGRATQVMEYWSTLNIEDALALEWNPADPEFSTVRRIMNRMDTAYTNRVKAQDKVDKEAEPHFRFLNYMKKLTS